MTTPMIFQILFLDDYTFTFANATGNSVCNVFIMKTLDTQIDQLLPNLNEQKVFLKQTCSMAPEYKKFVQVGLETILWDLRVLKYMILDTA